MNFFETSLDKKIETSLGCFINDGKNVKIKRSRLIIEQSRAK
jgi:hypothetical protein